MAVLIMGTKEFEQLVIFPGDYSDLRFTFAVITHLALHHHHHHHHASLLKIVNKTGSLFRGLDVATSFESLVAWELE